MDFNNIVGEAKNGEITDIRLFGKVTELSANQFNAEFDYLENIIHPSLIRVHINTEGGSVLHGMSIYATIQNSKIPTECIIEGMAASMGSIIWAAGKRSLMRDYSILMIHNPFIPSMEDSQEASELVKAFTKQLETIYIKRFGLKKEQVKKIMDGEAEKDGTFFDAKSAVEFRIIPPENILKTSPQIRDKVKNAIANIKDHDYSQIIELLSNISCEVHDIEITQPINAINPILNKNPNNMEDNKIELSTIAATLGLNDDKIETKDVLARVSLLTSIEAKYQEAQKSLTDAQVVIAGKEATIQNQIENIKEISAKLSQYEQKEANEKKGKIENLINSAISEGKIEISAKDNWIEMAEANYTLAEITLASIPPREKISKEIANDPHNIAQTEKGSQNIEQQLAEKVSAIVGKDFQFRKIE